MRHRRQTPQLVVEFVGIPGAGKSRVAAALAQELSRRFDVAFPDRFEYRRWSLSRAEELALDLRHAPSSACYRLRRLWFDLRRAGPGLWVTRQSWRNSRYPVVLLEKMRRDPRQVYVLDEWLLHRTIEESIRSYDAGPAFAAAFAFPPRRTPPVIYACVETHPAVARDRILKEDNSYRWFARSEDAGTIEQTLRAWQAQLQALKAEMRRRGLPCVEIDGSDPIDANAKRLAAHVEAALRVRTDPA